MSFCPKCGTQSADATSKFCHRCGAALVIDEGQSNGGSELAQRPAESKNPLPKETSESHPDSDEHDDGPVKAYEKGFRLEKTVEAILQAQGYSTKQRERVSDGKTSEIDIIATRERKGQVETLAVECKNYSSPVPVKEIQAFQAKLTKFGFKNGLFAAEPTFSSEARQWGLDYRMMLWDAEQMKELHWRASIGRLGTSEISRLPIYLPALVEYDEAVRLDFKNKERVAVVDVALVWKPYYKVSYSLKCSRTDPAKHIHSIEDSGVIVADGLSGRVLVKSSKAKNVGKRLLGQSDEQLQETKETDAVLEELEQEPDRDLSVPKTQNYRTIVHKQMVTEERVRRGALASVVESNTETVYYKLRKDEDDPFTDEREFRLVPSPKDIRLNVEVAYVPKWEVEFQSGEYKYVRVITGNSGATIYDTVTYCSGHVMAGFTKKKNVAVCEVCGKALCKDHVSCCPTCGSWRCGAHSTSCTNCGTKFCPEHIKATCAECGGAVCAACVRTCPVCGEQHCKKHMTTCSKCHRTVCVSCTRREGGFLSLAQRVYCRDC